MDLVTSENLMDLVTSEYIILNGFSDFINTNSHILNLCTCLTNLMEFKALYSHLVFPARWYYTHKL